VRHRWISESEFTDELYLFVDEYNRAGLPEPFDPPAASEVAGAAATIVGANEPVYGRQRFRALIPKCAFAFYELCKQHFFFTANKRIATFFLLHLLERHGLTLDMNRRALARFAERVAASHARDRQDVIRNAAAVIRKHVVVSDRSRAQAKKR